MRYKEKFRHCNVPRSKSGEYQSLGNWCDTLRKSYKKIRKSETPHLKLTEENIRQLEDAGFIWSLMRWRISWLFLLKLFLLLLLQVLLFANYKNKMHCICTELEMWQQFVVYSQRRGVNEQASEWVGNGFRWDESFWQIRGGKYVSPPRMVWARSDMLHKINATVEFGELYPPVFACTPLFWFSLV